MSELVATGLSKSFGAVPVLQNINLVVRDCEFVVLVGPSGCGKSTLLRLMAGLESISSGDLLIDGERMNDVPPAKRGLAMVFQSYALYPHMTVAQNMSVGLRIAGEDKAVIRRKVDDAARILQLGELLDRLPKQLSGGQRQRVAIGRAIVRDPKIFLFDEPLSNLDASLRLQMRLELARLKVDLRATMIYVTHDQVEAMTLADRIVVMNAGRIEQIGTPLDLYRSPANRFVAGFIGSPKMNFLDATIRSVSGGKADIELTAGGVVREISAPKVDVGDNIVLGVRPEHMLTGKLRTTSARFSGLVTVVERLGASSIAYTQLPDGTPVTVALDGMSEVVSGSWIDFGFAPDSVHIFSPDGHTL